MIPTRAVRAEAGMVPRVNLTDEKVRDGRARLAEHMRSEPRRKRVEARARSAYAQRKSTLDDD